MEECGIFTTADLKNIQAREDRRELNCLTKDTRQRLIRVSKLGEFDEDEYYSLCVKEECTERASGYATNILGSNNRPVNQKVRAL